MLSKRPTWVRFAVPIGVFALVLLVEDGLINLFPTVTMLYSVLFLTAFGGAFVMSTFLPHPRQERKRREALLRKQGEQDRIEAGFAGFERLTEIRDVKHSLVLADEEETLAEKRP